MEAITSLEALAAHYGTASAASIEKETPVINDAYRKLINAAPFFAVASIGPEGMDCSPRGDGAGFVQILDDNTIAFADRRGNNRLDTLRNIVQDPRIALMFLIPGVNEALRINGMAIVTADEALCAQFIHQGKKPATVVVVKVETMYFQCARAIIRAGLWDEASKVDRISLPSAGELVKSVKADFPAAEYDAALPQRQNETLY